MANLPMTFVANLPKLWRTFQFCGEPSLWRTFLYSERSRPQGPKNVHNFLMTVRPLSWACGHGTEMLLILKNYFWPDYSQIFSDMTVQRNVPRFFMRSICGWNLFQPLGLLSFMISFIALAYVVMYQVLHIVTLWIFWGLSDGNCAYVHWGSFTSNSESVRRAIWFTWFSEPQDNGACMS